jgi:hypothetical protein
MVQTMGSASAGKHLLRLVIVAVLFVASLARADDTTFTVGGNFVASWPTGYRSYLRAAESLGSSFAYIACDQLGDSLGGDMTVMDPVLSTASALNMKICLATAWVDTVFDGWWKANVTGLSSGLSHRYEAEDICAQGDIGDTVQDVHAENGLARGVGNAGGWLQTGQVGVWSGVSSFPYTAVFRFSSGDTFSNSCRTGRVQQ